VSPDRRTLLALFSIAFGLRILYAALIGTSPAINPSPGTYDFYLAERIQDGMQWVRQPFTPYAPAYPLLLAAVFRVFGVGQWVAILLQAFIGAATVLFLYRVGEKQLGRGVGLLSALWLGAFVHQMHFASIFVRGTLETFALTWFAYTLVRPFQRMRQAVWAGLLYTILVHVDAQFLVLFPVIVLFFLLFATRHRLLNLQYMLLWVATVFVLCLPWTVRNYFVYGEALPVGLEAKKYLKPAIALVSRGEPGSERSRIAGSVGVVMAHADGFVPNSIEFWRVVRLHDTPGDPARSIREEPAWSLRHNLVNTANFGVLLPFFAVGIVLAFVRRNRAALVLTLLIASCYLTCAFVGAVESSRLPVEPLVILVAIYGFYEVLRAVRRPAAAASTPGQTPAG
jgi:4-amino-4-deoxy-L-arabinose transferase-like glycosyltransferase